MNQKLPKVLKLKSKKQIETLFKMGSKIKGYPLLMVYYPTSLEVPFQFSCSVSKRFFKKAVDRNRIKRLIRENFRKKKYIFDNDGNSYLIMFLYVGKEMPTYATVAQSFQKIERKWQKIISDEKA